MHQEPGGSSVFARYAFNELVSFVAGWAIVLDYTLLVAVTAVAAANYLATFWSPLGEGVPEVLLALCVVGYATWHNVLGISAKRLQRRVLIVLVDLTLQIGLIALGFVLVFSPDAIIDPIQLGTSPEWGDVVFALTIAAVAFTGLEAAASLSREVDVTRADLKRLAGPGTAAIVAVYVGMALVAISALPVKNGHTALADEYGLRPLVGVAKGLDARLALDGAHVRRRRGRGRLARRGGELGHARRLAHGAGAGHQPPDPRRARAACIRGAARPSS